MLRVRRFRVAPVFAAGSLVLGAGVAWAREEAFRVDPGDTAWVLTASALVMAMTLPGLALFYGGMSRRKHVLSTIMLSFASLCLVSVQWVLWGYTLSFGPDVGKLIGGLAYLGLRGILPGSVLGGQTIPHFAFVMFQGMFAVITVALITGAFVERMKFGAFLVFALLWTTVVYDPLAHWVWGGGWLGELGALDFAGGTVVHVSSGVSALAAALVIGRRKGYGSEPMPPHNLPLTVLGAGLLWFGWFGFNAGSALASNGLATHAFAVTHVATASAALAWMVSEWLQRSKPTALGVASGAVSGLVAITPAAGYVGPLAAIAIGVGAGLLCYMAVNFVKPILGYDDSLDVFGIHGVGGTWGAIATGLFASEAVGGANGLFFGNPAQLWVQLVAVAATWALAFGATFVLFKLLDGTMGLRVPEEDEVTGLDLSVHGESGYGEAVP